MIKTLKNFGGKKLGGVILIAVIVIAFGFGGFPISYKIHIFICHY